MCGSQPSTSMQDLITPEMKEERKINAELWNYYQEYYQPLIEKYTERVTSPEIQEAERRQVAGDINARVMASVPPTGSINPVKTAENLGEIAKTGSGAQVKGQGAVRSRQLGEIQNVINIGRGTATQAQAGLSELAGQSLSNELFEKRLEAAEAGLTGQTIGAGIGTAAALGTRMLDAPTQLFPKKFEYGPTEINDYLFTQP